MLIPTFASINKPKLSTLSFSNSSAKHFKRGGVHGTAIVRHLGVGRPRLRTYFEMPAGQNRTISSGLTVCPTPIRFPCNRMSVKAYAACLVLRPKSLETVEKLPESG